MFAVEIPVGRRQRLNIEYLYRDYRESIKEKYKYHDWSTLTSPEYGNISKNYVGVDTVLVREWKILSNQSFYRDREFVLTWNYRKLKPTRDWRLNPSGGRFVSLQFRHHSATIADTLVEWLQYTLPIDLDGDGEPDEIPVDEFSDLLRPLKDGL